jgi:hypothetical protein
VPVGWWSKPSFSAHQWPDCWSLWLCPWSPWTLSSKIAPMFAIASWY